MTESQIREALMPPSNNLERTFLAVVEDNNPTGDFVSVRCTSGTLYEDVRKRASLNDNPSDKNGIIITPALGSVVVVSRLGTTDDLYVAMFSDIESVIIDGGLNGGLVKIQELEDNLKSLKDMVEAINAALPSAFTAIGASSAAVGANGATSYNASMAGKSISFSDMENSKIKH